MNVRMSGNRYVVLRTALYRDKTDQTMMHSRKSMAASAPTFIANNSGAGFRNAAGASVVGQGAQDNDGMSFFEREKARLIEEIGIVSLAGLIDISLSDCPTTQGFEDLLGSANTLNRKLEEVFGVGKEFQTVADLWGVGFRSRDVVCAMS
jgi:hypothetical protein